MDFASGDGVTFIWGNNGRGKTTLLNVFRYALNGKFQNWSQGNRPSVLPVLVTAINNMLSGKDAFLTTLQDNITTVLSKENDKTLTDIDNRLEELQTQLLRLASSKRTSPRKSTICVSRSKMHWLKMQDGMNCENV